MTEPRVIARQEVPLGAAGRSNFKLQARLLRYSQCVRFAHGLGPARNDGRAGRLLCRFAPRNDGVGDYGDFSSQPP